MMDLLQLQALVMSERWREMWEALIGALPDCRECTQRIATHVERVYPQHPPIYRCTECLGAMLPEDQEDFRPVPWAAHLAAYRLITGKPAPARAARGKRS